MAAYDKPLPRGEDFNGEFYRFCKQHELRFQRCQGLRRMASHAARKLSGLRLVQLGLGTRRRTGGRFSVGR